MVGPVTSRTPAFTSPSVTQTESTAAAEKSDEKQKSAAPSKKSAAPPEDSSTTAKKGAESKSVTGSAGSAPAPDAGSMRPKKQVKSAETKMEAPIAKQEGPLSNEALASAIPDINSKSPDELRTEFYAAMKNPEYGPKLLGGLAQMAAMNTPESKQAYEKAMGVIKDLYQDGLLPTDALKKEVGKMSGPGGEQMKADATKIAKGSDDIQSLVGKSKEQLQTEMAEKMKNPKELASFLQGLASSTSESGAEAYRRAIATLAPAMVTQNGVLSTDGHKVIEEMAKLQGPGSSSVKAVAARMLDQNIKTLEASPFPGSDREVTNMSKDLAKLFVSDGPGVLDRLQNFDPPGDIKAMFSSMIKNVKGADSINGMDGVGVIGNVLGQTAGKAAIAGKSGDVNAEERYGQLVGFGLDAAGKAIDTWASDEKAMVKQGKAIVDAFISGVGGAFAMAGGSLGAAELGEFGDAIKKKVGEYGQKALDKAAGSEEEAIDTAAKKFSAIIREASEGTWDKVADPSGKAQHGIESPERKDFEDRRIRFRGNIGEGVGYKRI